MNENIVLPSAYNLEKKIKNRLDKFADKMNDSKIMKWFGHVFISNLFYIYLFNKYKSKCLVKHKNVEISNYPYLGIKIFLDYERIDQYEDQIFDDVVKQLAKCINRGIETIIIPLTLRVENYGHANVLIYRKINNSIEHFEPYGSNAELGEFHQSVLDRKLQTFMYRLNDHLQDEYDVLTQVEFIPAFLVCPHSKGLQELDEEIQNSILANGEEETGGYCVAWSMFFTELVLQNPEISSGELLTNVLKSTSLNTEYIKKLIRGYVLNISEKLEKYFHIFFGGTIHLDTIYKIINSGNEGVIENFMDEVVDIEMILLNEEFDKDTFMKNIEKQILSIQKKIYLVEHLIERFFGFVKKPKKKYFELVDEKTALNSELDKLYIKRKFLENIHILEEANRSAELEDANESAELEDANRSAELEEANLSAELEDALKSIAINESLKCPKREVRNINTGKCNKPQNKTKKASPITKRLSGGKERNPKSRRCIPLKNSRKKKTPVQKSVRKEKSPIQKQEDV